MTPLFDKNANLTAWFDEENGNIFDTELRWIAFVDDGHVFSSKTVRWLGPVEHGTMLDQNGRPIFWNPEQAVAGKMPAPRPARKFRMLKPLRPLWPMEPLRPPRPAPPEGGWSGLSFKQWLAQK